ncbi:MAG: winged helix-turn-helix domain-containing protein, partial [Terriglobales bacterium]
ARLRALIRRPIHLSGNCLNLGDLSLDAAAHTVKKAGKEVTLLPKEFALLEFLMRHPDQIFSQEAILSRVWASTSESVPDTVRFHIASLRKKLDSDGEESIIQTVHKAGYKLVVRD